MITTCIRIERANITPAPPPGEAPAPPVYKVRLITREGDVLIPTREQEAAALSLMAMFDPADPPDPDMPDAPH